MCIQKKLDIDFHAKQLKDLKSLGCTREDVSAAAYRVYLDLREVRQYEAVSYHVSRELDHLYLKGRKNFDEEEEIIVPVLATKSFTFKEMEKFQAAFSSDSIKLAICDPSSTIMYYKLTKS